MDKPNNQRLVAVAPRGERPARRHVSTETNRPRDLTSIDDELNQKIVRMLEIDGRRAFADIAAQLNVSEGTIRNRVNSMRQSKQIKIAAIVDPGAAEYVTTAMIGIKVSSHVTPAQVAERFQPLEEVVYILWVSGRHDLLIEIVSDEKEGLISFLENHIYGKDDISDTETMAGLRNYKNQFLLKQNWS